MTQGRVNDKQQQQLQGFEFDFLTTKDLQVLEQARMSGDLKALKQHITLLAEAVPALRMSRIHEAEKVCQKRLPYLKQSALEVELSRRLFQAAKSRLSDAGDECVGQHATATPWQMLTTIAEALGFSISESGCLQRQSQDPTPAPSTQPHPPLKPGTPAGGSDDAAAMEQPQPHTPHGNPLRAPPRALAVPREAVEDVGEAAYLNSFAVHCMEATADDLANLPEPSLAKALEPGIPEKVLEGLLWPCSPDDFAASIRQNSALLVQRKVCRSFYDGIFSSEDLWKLLSEQKLQYGANVDVTLFTVAERRRTFNDNLCEGAQVGEPVRPGVAGATPGGKRKGKKRKKNGIVNNSNSSGQPSNGERGDAEAAAAASNVADVRVVRWRYSEGCSVRLLHPQRWLPSVAELLAPLEQLLQCCLGCNVYLTPAACQGFAPHFDDVDVYILQVEGAKRWRVYAPLPGHALPRYSSRDFEDEEIGEPLLDTVLRPGDLLYLPRGTIHQAEALPEQHSMHLTVSSEQQRTWADFMQVAMHEALEDTRKACFAARMTVTPWLFHSCGLMHANRLAASPVPDVPPSVPPLDGPSIKPSRTSQMPGNHHQKSDRKRRKKQRRMLQPASSSHAVVTGASCQSMEAEGWPVLPKTFQKLPEVRAVRSAIEATADSLMHAMRRSMRSVLDKAADQLASKFVAERLPPLWLRRTAASAGKGGGARAVGLRAAYDDGDGMRVASGLRVPAATVAALVDTNDPECLEVRHCMNNTCEQHATAGSAAHAPHEVSGAEAEEDVLKLPFFLIPRSIGALVAKRLLKHDADALVDPNTAATNANDCDDVSAAAAPAHRKRADVASRKSKRSRCEPAAGRDTKEGFSSQEGVCERESAWEVQEREAENEEAAAGDIERVDAEDCKELVVEVECTLAELGIWVGPSIVGDRATDGL